MLTYNLAIYHGDSYRRRFVLWADAARTVPYDLTGVTVAAWIDLCGRIHVLALTVTDNEIDLEVTAAQSQALEIASGKWDLQLTYTTSGEVRTIVAGAVQVRLDVTGPTPAVGV
jgi:hypothetical protein